MSMSDYSLSDVAAVTRGNNGGFANGWGDDGLLILVLLLLFAGRGWGNGFGGGNNGYAGGDALYPWLNQAQLTTQGFADQNAVMALNSIQQGLNALSTQLCNCCSNMQMSLANGLAGIETNANARQMANMQQMYGLSQQFSDCCCENRLGLANLNATILSENCADRAALSDGIRDILVNNNANTQRILDQMCNDKIDEKNDEITQLRNQLNFANLAASQIAQNSQIIDGLYNRLATCPVGTQPVYGNQPIFTCNSGCGCAA